MRGLLDGVLLYEHGLDEAHRLFAIKHAILAARKDRGHDERFALEAPATVQRIREACLVEAEDLVV